MPPTANYLAIDLGASSGRAVLGSFDGAHLKLRELDRFPNTPLELATGLHWDTQRLFDHIKRALALTHREGTALNGLGIDTWGVDYALLSPTGELLAPPHHYRDPRTRNLMEQAFRLAPRDHIYARTGIQFMPLNTLYQLLADQLDPTHPLARAHKLLFIPDLLNYWLTGLQRTERTIASTSQLYDPAQHTWATDLIEQLHLPAHLFPDIAPAGTPLGPLLPALAEETGAGPVPVIAPASHDTASAVVAVPAVGSASGPNSDWAYISSGTWALVGRELSAPLRTPEARAANFTNECGAHNTIRFHKNVAGLWLLQECQRHWAAHHRAYTFDQLRDLTLAAPPFATLIDPDHPSFADFGDMPARIRDYCLRDRRIRTHRQPPDSDGALTRCILESLALKCATAIDSLESLTGPVRTIHLVGGGAQNPLLCQFTANATARPVLAGPVEATAAGNVMIQALAQGKVSTLTDIRTIIAASLPPTRYHPQDPDAWAHTRSSFRELVAT